MLDKVVAFVAGHAGKERPVAIRIVSIVCGLSLFLVAVPVILGAVGHLIAQSVAITVPRNVEVLLGATGTIVGLFFLS